MFALQSAGDFESTGVSLRSNPGHPSDQNFKNRCGPAERKEDESVASQKDGSGNEYFDVGNIRITAVKQTFDAGKPGLRIQAYKGIGQSLHPGAEIPIPDKATAFDLLKAISQALESNGL